MKRLMKTKKTRNTRFAFSCICHSFVSTTRLGCLGNEQGGNGLDLPSNEDRINVAFHVYHPWTTGTQCSNISLTCTSIAHRRASSDLFHIVLRTVIR